MPLTLGHITYLNCIPFFHHLRQAGFAGKIRPGVPAELNRLLAEGAIDVSPSSSFEYARNWKDYLLLPGLSISSFGPVKSVLLFSGRPLEQLSEETIFLTGESATSVHLLQILLREFHGFAAVDCRVPESPVEEVVERGGAALLIGDRALKEARNGRAAHVFDLGELWRRHTGLPFVFALWIVRLEAAREKAEELHCLSRQLKTSRAQAFADLQSLTDAVLECSFMGKEGLLDYWRSMSYDLGEEHLRGLRLYFDLLAKYRFLPDRPLIRFFE